MPAEIQQFFERYRDAFNRLESRAVTGLYAIPSIIASAGDATVFSAYETLEANNLALCEQYRRSGFVRADFTENMFLAQGNDFALADLAWTITRQDVPSQHFNTTYQLMRDSQDWKVLLVTAHSEPRPWLTESAHG